MAIAHTADCPVAAMADDARRLYGVQFHPEVTHTEEGARVLENFLFGICGCKGDWSMDAYADMAVEQIREQVGDGTVLLGLSGGVDSAVAAALLYLSLIHISSTASSTRVSSSGVTSTPCASLTACSMSLRYMS